jgi:hypothetical protein
LIKPEKLLAFSGQKRWIFLPELGSPGKVGNKVFVSPAYVAADLLTLDFETLSFSLEGEDAAAIFFHIHHGPVAHSRL